jgi:hypothetical protein
MRKTFIIIFLFIGLTILIALSFSSFLVTEKKLRYADCVLLQNSETKAVDCFGCYNNICKDAPKEWEPYIKPEIGIPYACFKNDQGCQLAQ